MHTFFGLNPHSDRRNTMRYQTLMTGLLLFMLIIIPVSAFEIREGDSIVISSPITDDLLVSGGTVIINAPVKSVTFAGGTLIVNAPVKENLIAAGGEIQVNAPVGTDLIAAGGRININNDVGGKVLAAGGQATMDGKTSNLAVTGGKVNLGTASHITGDALISASDFSAVGKVDGELKTDSERGSEKPSVTNSMETTISLIFTILSVLFAIGMLILGVILIRIMPGPFTAVTANLGENALISFIFGVAGIIISVILILILIVTIIGIPIALLIGLATLIGVITSTLFTGSALGSWIAGKTGRKLSITWSFVVGFIVLEILFLIPILGFLLYMIAICAGLGALLMTTWKAVETQTLAP